MGFEVEPRQPGLLQADGGEGGIRTHGTFRYNGFRDRHNKPSSATSPQASNAPTEASSEVKQSNSIMRLKKNYFIMPDNTLFVGHLRQY